MVADFTTANNPRFLHFAEVQRPFPDWVANAPIPSADEFEKCAASAFADRGRRLLPILSKEATFHSALDLFAHVEDYDAEVFERVKNACEFHGISADVAPYAEVFADSFEKNAAESAAPTGRWAIDTELNGQRFQLLPLDDASSVSNSAYELAKMAGERRIHFLTLVPAAVEVVKAAADHGAVGLPRLIVHLGSERFPDFEKAAELIEGREKLSKTGDQATLRGLYQEAVKEAATGEITAEECMTKIAAIDDAAGLTYKLKESATFPNAADVIFTGPLVSEAEKQATLQVAIRDVLIPLEAVKTISLVEADFKLSKSAGESLRKNIETNDAKDISLAVMSWEEKDQRTLLRILANA
jgi:hypothetical protein